MLTENLVEAIVTNDAIDLLETYEDVRSLAVDAALKAERLIKDAAPALRNITGLIGVFNAVNIAVYAATIVRRPELEDLIMAGLRKSDEAAMISGYSRASKVRAEVYYLRITPAN